MGRLVNHPPDPPDEGRDPHPLEEEILQLLEKAGCDFKVVDQVAEKLDQLVNVIYALPRECAACEARAWDAVEEENKQADAYFASLRGDDYQI